MIRVYFYSHQNLHAFIMEAQALAGGKLGTVNRLELCVAFSSLEWGRFAPELQGLARERDGRIVYA